MAGVKREMWLPADPRSAGLARRAVREAAERAQLGSREVHDVTLATSEAVANAVEHGSPCDGRGVRLVVTAEVGEVTVEVCDCGTFPGSLPAALTDRGRGLPIIGAVCDHVEIHPSAHATRIRFGKSRRPDAPRDQAA